MLATLLWMGLAASAGVLSGIFWDRTVDPTPTPLLPVKDVAGKIDFFRIVKIIGIMTAGSLALILITRVLKIRTIFKSR